MTHSRFVLSCLAFLLGAFVSAGCSGDVETPPAEPQTPNVILISIDTLRADHVGV